MLSFEIVDLLALDWKLSNVLIAEAFLRFFVELFADLNAANYKVIKKFNYYSEFYETLVKPVGDNAKSNYILSKALSRLLLFLAHFTL